MKRSLTEPRDRYRDQKSVELYHYCLQKLSFFSHDETRSIIQGVQPRMVLVVNSHYEKRPCNIQRFIIRNCKNDDFQSFFF